VLLFSLKSAKVRAGFPAFRERLAAAGFSQDTLAATLNLNHPAESPDVAVLLRKTEEPTPYNIFFRLFVLGVTVDMIAAREAFKPKVFELLAEARLLVPHNEDGEDLNGIQAAVKLVPYEGYYCASDFSVRERGGAALAGNFVPGVSPASVTLANFTIRNPVESTFDLGTGIGIHAMLAARHSGRVVGSDLNERALEFARLNAALNGLDNIEWVTGSFFEPVAGRRFDLVVANPPFVISPRSRYLYRDGGLSGDGVSEHVARGVVEHLNEGGYAVMLANWFYKEDEEWDTRPRRWLDANGCDAWLIRSADAEPITYAANWLKQTEAGDPERYARMLGEWLEYYESEGIHRLCSGALILRKRGGGANWVRSDTMHAVMGTRPSGDHVHRIFQAEDYLSALPSDEALYDVLLQCHPDVTVNQILEPDGAEWAAKRITLGCGRGLPFGGDGDGWLLQFLMRLNGTATMRCVLEKLQSETGDTQEFASYLAVVKKLIRSGMVVPV